MRYAAVIAAAGLSSRMRDFKPMLCLGENTMIETVIQNFKDAGVDEIIVVVGYKAELLRRHLKPSGVKLCENPDYAQTKMLDSLKLGIRALESPYDAVFFSPGDVPLVHAKTIRLMQETNAPMVRPVHQGHPGHPVLLRKLLIPELLAYTGERGLQGAMEAFGVPVLDIPVDDAGVILDADTPDDFRVLHRRSMEMRSGGQLWPDIRIHIAKGDTILTSETAQFLEMINHTGSIQNACACMHISYTNGWKKLNQMETELGYPLVARQSGGSSGGGSTLTPKGLKLLFAYQEYRDRVRELSRQLFTELFPEELNH